jgi:hypothetical protein
VTSTTNEPLPVLSVSPDAGRAVRMRLVVRESEDIDANPDGVVSAAREPTTP